MSRGYGCHSFVVVAWAPPTTLDSVQELYALIPGKLYLHLGAETPFEKRVGPGLMHSKVFFARAGNDCWLWTGSHNLTASAAQGVNCEAAIVLEGKIDEMPFQEALAHLNRCRAEAVIFDPYHPPPPPHREPTLIIHAESDVASKPCPWFVHMRPSSTRYDALMGPPGDVWLFLYSRGSLRVGVPRPQAQAAYSGTITALNFTEHHPTRGIPADRNGADYVVEQDKGIFHLMAPMPHARTPTQGVFRLEQPRDPSTIWLSESPAPKLERLVGDSWTSDVDPEFRGFFTKRSVEGDHLVHRQYRELRPTYGFSEKEVGSQDSVALRRRLDMPPDSLLEIARPGRADDPFEFIYRAKYRV